MPHYENKFKHWMTGAIKRIDHAMRDEGMAFTFDPLRGRFTLFTRTVCQVHKSPRICGPFERMSKKSKIRYRKYKTRFKPGK